MSATDEYGLSVPAPCQCHQSHAFVTPTHPGHCCFRPPSQTCHQAEVDAWEQERDRLGCPASLFDEEPS